MVVLIMRRSWVYYIKMEVRVDWIWNLIICGGVERIGDSKVKLNFLVWIYRNIGVVNYIKGNRRESFIKDIYFFFIELFCMFGYILYLLNVWDSVKDFYVGGKYFFWSL